MACLLCFGFGLFSQLFLFFPAPGPRLVSRGQAHILTLSFLAKSAPSPYLQAQGSHRWLQAPVMTHMSTEPVSGLQTHHASLRGELLLRARRNEAGLPLCGPEAALGFRGVSWVLVTERYSPPHNITVHCNKSRCLIQWEKPRTRRRVSPLDFQFQLDIRTQVRGRCFLQGPWPMEPGDGDPGTGGG